MHYCIEPDNNARLVALQTLVAVHYTIFRNFAMGYEWPWP